MNKKKKPKKQTKELPMEYVGDQMIEYVYPAEKNSQNKPVPKPSRTGA